MDNFQKKDAQPVAKIFPLAIVIGMFCFFITDEISGGLNGIGGFMLGIGSVLTLFIVIGVALILLDSFTKRPPAIQDQIGLLRNISVSNTEKDIITIQIKFKGHTETIHLSLPNNKSESIHIAPND